MTEKVILVRFGEIFLKGKNRDYFESLLIGNIKRALNGLRFRFARSQGRYFIEDFSPEDEFEIIMRLKKVFGIHSLSAAEKVPTKADEDFPHVRECLRQTAIRVKTDYPSEIVTFRVSVKRADKRIAMTSAEIAASLGGTVLETEGFKVSLKHYRHEFCVDVRENGYSFVFTDTIAGAGGLPVGCSGKGMLLLSGGIDSPVAGYMMAKRGMKLLGVHFSSPPYTSEKARDKVVTLRNLLTPYTDDIKLFVVPFTDIQLEIHTKCPAEFMITIMRRFMMRIASQLALKNGCGALITGESLGQVASQTVESMTSTEAAAELPLFRPLIGFDKDDITELAKKIGTFETSILPYEDCCTIFLPSNPAIRPKIEAVERAESALDIEGLVSAALEGTEIF